MGKSLIDEYTDEEFRRIIATSYSYKECLRNLGYNSCSGGSERVLKSRIQQKGIDVSHFKSFPRTKWALEDVFTKNSKAGQSTLRRWYEKNESVEYKCAICGQKPFWNNKPMILVLDHINGINNDNRLENLRWVCGNCNMQLDTMSGRNIRHREHQLNHCVDCGQVIYRGSSRCLECERKRKIKPLDNMPVTRTELKQLIRAKSFIQIGKMYNVTDNTIKKWCDKFKLPRKKIDIMRYSDEEWCNI